MPLPPALTPEQRQAALDKAAHARKVRAEIKERLKLGTLKLAELFAIADQGDDHGTIVGKLKVVAALEALPGLGKVRARKLMEELGISESRRLRGLGDKQRQGLLTHFANES